MTKSSLI
jgi:Kelch motif/Galactose oxidase, central domain